MKKALALSVKVLVSFISIQSSTVSMAEVLQPYTISRTDAGSAVLDNKKRALGTYPSLRNSRDSKLQLALNNITTDLKLQPVIRASKISIALVDITDVNKPRFSGVNSDVMLYAASLPKIAILFGFFKRVEQGTLPLSSQNIALAEQMIRFSSNTAATELLNKVGMKYLATLLQSPEFKLYEKNNGGGLWVGKEYGKKAATMRDPLKQLSHGASAIKVARFYYLLETNRLVNADLTEKMKSILANPGIHHKFVKGLDQTCPNAEIMRKSGTWRQWHADSAIVSHGGKTYIAVVLVDDDRGSQLLPQLIQKMDKAIFAGAQETGCHAKS